jgi:hypothetical protein
MFKVIITGGENFGDYNTFERKCINCLKNKAREGNGIIIYTTGDAYNNKFAKKFGINVREFNANFTKDGNNALFERNKQMLSDADAAIIFNDDLNDTKFLIDQIKHQGIPMRVIDK